MVAGLIGGGLGLAEASGRAKALNSADATLGELFNGADMVTYDSRPYDSLEATPVIQGGAERGYILVNNDAGVLLFKRD